MSHDERRGAASLGGGYSTHQERGGTGQNDTMNQTTHDCAPSALLIFASPAHIASYQERAKELHATNLTEGTLSLPAPSSGHSTIPMLPTLRVAANISELFRAVYQDRYHRRVLHDPTFILEQILSGSWIAFCFTDPHGCMLAHGALLRETEREWKFARSVVHPGARGLGLSSQVFDASVEFARQQLRCSRLSSEAVTAHGRTQSLFASRGFNPAAIFPGKFADYFDSGRRESTILYHKWLAPERPSRRPIFVCASLENFVASLVASIGAPLAPNVQCALPRAEGRMSIKHIEGMHSRLLTIEGPLPEVAVRSFIASHTPGVQSNSSTSPQNRLPVDVLGLDYGHAAPSTNVAETIKYTQVAVNVSDPSGERLSLLCLEMGFLPLGVESTGTHDWLLLGHGEMVCRETLAALKLEDTKAQRLVTTVQEMWTHQDAQPRSSSQFLSRPLGRIAPAAGR